MQNIAAFWPILFDKLSFQEAIENFILLFREFLWYFMSFFMIKIDLVSILETLRFLSSYKVERIFIATYMQGIDPWNCEIKSTI